MSTAKQLRDLIRSGYHRIGELEIQTDVYGYTYLVCHHEDVYLSEEGGLGGLDLHDGPDKARDLSTYAADGTYRFNKAQRNLQRGWALGLHDEEELRQALDLFYPACLGLFLASREGRLEVQNLRDKLARQTGMYRFAKSISDSGAQKLVRDTCGPDKACAKKILWQIDAATPLEDSPASSYTGIPEGLAETEVIPLFCREACNHFVAECRKAAKAEFEVKNEAE